MVTCTPNYMLPYIEGTDRPCDQGGTWCDFTAAVNTQLTSLNRLLDRTVTSVPMFEVYISAPYTFPDTGRAIGFDSVTVDTDNMVDLEADQFSFPINTLGRWLFYFRTSTNGNTALQANIPASVVTVPSQANLGIVQDFQDSGVNYPAYIEDSGILRFNTTGFRVNFTVATAATNVLTAVFGGYWVGDL